jgi:chaperone required for assembly of F1-ATPase
VTERDTLTKARRFYADVGVAEVEGGHAVRLDGRQARTWGGSPLVLPTPALADLVAAEWAAQGPQVEPVTMAATRLAAQVLDGGEGARRVQLETVARYGASDLVCYFAETPRSLLARQEATWGPLLDWAGEDLGLVFLSTRGIVHVAQPPQTLAALAALAGAAEPFDLAALAFGAALFGSTVVSLALRHGRLDAQGALAAARLDEVFQQEQWGVDAEAAARATAMAAEAAMAQRWFEALV